MSLATNIKEFADLLHNIYAQQLSSVAGTDIPSESVLPLAIPKIVVIQQAFIYLLKSFGSGILYFLTFEWVRDFSYFPLLSPEIQNESSIVPDTFLAQPGSYLFSFSKNGVTLFSSTLQSTNNNLDLSSTFTSFLKGDQLLAGFVNSFFFSLPFSLPHLITVRRMFSQGAAAAAASIFGTIAAHSLLLLGVLYGIRFLIIPFYSLEPLTFLIGTVTIAIVINEFVKEKRVYLVPLLDSRSLVRIGVLNFVLALCESATVFHDLHHLTLNKQISYLQLYESQTALDSFFIHTAYLLAFVLGHILFSFLFCYLILKGNERLCSLTGWTLPKTVRQINKALLVVIVTLTFSLFPYYGLDYLFTKSAGFLPEDPAYINTIFSPTQVRSRNRHFKSRAPATKNSKTPLELDLNYFDRGMYLNAPKVEKMASDPYKAENSIASFPEKDETVATYDPALTFEELNYQGESAWLMRHERARRLPDEQDSKKESVFQKPKTHFKELRLKQDTKQAEAALKEGSQIGSIPEWKEGSLRGERLPFYSEDLSPSVHALTSPNPGGVRATTGHFTEGDKVEAFEKSKGLEGDTLNSSSEQNLDKRALLKELSFEKEIAANYEKSFASPFGEESDGTPPDLLPVENIIKKRYRLNPVYRALLQTDIDSFIARQPADYKITQNQEASLFKKRQLLEKYYNSIRYYAPIESVDFANLYGLNPFSFSEGSRHLAPSVNEGDTHYSALKNKDELETRALLCKSSLTQCTEDLYDPVEEKGSFPYKSKTSTPFTKSFIETTYHQQFKGTLNTVKRFFKLTFDEQQNPNRNRILSYDQPLYKNHSSLSVHPNLFSKSKIEKGKEQEGARGVKHGKGGKNNHPSLHEELELGRISPFVEESNALPIYAGWDDKARRFVITNRFYFVD